MKRIYETALYTYHLHQIEDHGRAGDLYLSFNREPNLLGMLLFRKSAVVRVVGNCTVWHYYPNGQRVGVEPFGGFDECLLSGIWKAYHWEQQENARGRIRKAYRREK